MRSLTSLDLGRYRLRAAALIAGTIILPIIVLRLVEGVAWDLPGDALFLGLLTLSSLLALEVAARLRPTLSLPAALAYAAAAGLLSIWINLAVGIVGSEDDPVNILFAAPPIIALLGSAAARFRTAGMATAMIAAAAAQLGVLLLLVFIGAGFTGPVTVFFVTLWLLSATLFRTAAGRSGAAHYA